MLPFKAGKKEFYVPVDWSELTLSQAIRLQKIKDKNDVIEFLSIMTGLTTDECNRIGEDDLNLLLIPLMNFVTEPFNEDELMKRSIPNPVVIGDRVIKKLYDAGQLSWAQHLTFDALIKDKALTDIQKVGKIISVCIQKPDEFTDEILEQIELEALQMNLFDAFAVAGFYLNSIKKFYEVANLKTETDYTSEQIRAGIKEFSKFGAFNSIDSLAGGDITKWNQVVQLPMNDVIIKMKMNQQAYKYEKKLNEIMSKKK